MSWFLGYLLVGFVISWAATQAGYVSKFDWQVELAAVILWPVALVCGVVISNRRSKNRR